MHPNYHHQVIFDKINLKIFYPPPSPREVWYCKNANIDRIKCSVTSFNCEEYSLTLA